MTPAAGNPQNPARNMDGTPRYNISYHVPVGLATVDIVEVSRLRRQAADLLALRASEVLSLDVTQIVVRSILPRVDLGYTNDAWLTASLTANSYVPLFTQKTLLPTQLLCFYGVVDLDPSPTMIAISFSKGPTRTMVIAQLDENYAWSQRAIGLIRPMVLYNPSDPVLVEGYSSVTQAHQIVLLGFEAEQFGVKSH